MNYLLKYVWSVIKVPTEYYYVNYRAKSFMLRRMNLKKNISIQVSQIFSTWF